MRKERLGRLQVRITEKKGGKDDERLTIILLHGFGAPGQDLVPLGNVMEVPLGTQFIFPVGPLAFQSEATEVRAWWPIDMDRLNRDVAARRWDTITETVPRGLSEARDQVVTLIDEAVHRLGTNPENIVLGGFSQGAILACDIALHTKIPFMSLVLLSGMLIAREVWNPLLHTRRGLRVFQSHGTSDPVLPVALARQLREFLVMPGLEVEWHGFRGGHGIPRPIVQKLAKFIRSERERKNRC